MQQVWQLSWLSKTPWDQPDVTSILVFQPTDLTTYRTLKQILLYFPVSEKESNSLSFGEDMTDDDLQLAADRLIGVDDKASKWGDVLDVDMFAGEDVILKCGSINWIIGPKRVYQLHIKTFYIPITLIPEYINVLCSFYHTVLTRWKWTENYIQI